MRAILNWLKTWLASTREARLQTLNAPLSPEAIKPAPPAPAPLVPAAPAAPAGVIFAIPPITSSFEESPNYRSSGDLARIIDLIVLHGTEGSFQGALETLKDAGRKPSPVSAHYVISKRGEFVQLVGENDVAWHAGHGTWGGRKNINERSVGIELETKNVTDKAYPEIQLQVLMWLCVRLCRRNYLLSAEKVVGHADVDPGRKTDPYGFPFERFRTSLAFHLSRPGGLV